MGSLSAPKEGAVRPFTLISVVFLSLVAAAHLVRALLGIEIRVGEQAIPVWASVIAFLFTATLAWLLSWEQRKL
jgi:hypothetical protein